MTDPVREINRADQVSSGGASTGGNADHGHKKKQTPHNDKDLVEISRRARELLPGEKKKSLLDYLKSLFSRHG